MSNLTCLFIVVIVIVIIAGVLTISNKRDKNLKSFINDDVKTIFKEVYAESFKDISICVIDGLFKKYNTYAEVSRHITFDEFTTNSYIRQLLPQCGFAILGQHYNSAVRATSIFCASGKYRDLIEWIKINVPYKDLTEDEIKEYVQKAQTSVLKNCWTEEEHNKIAVKIKELFVNYIKHLINREEYINATIHNKRYDDFMNTLAVIAARKLRENGYTYIQSEQMVQTNPPNSTKKFWDYYTDRLSAVLRAQMRIIVRTVYRWCKSPQDLINRMNSVEFREYSYEESDRIIESIIREAC